MTTEDGYAARTPTSFTFRLQISDLNFRRLAMAIDEEFARLEYPNIALQTMHNAGLIPPSTF